MDMRRLAIVWCALAVASAVSAEGPSEAAAYELLEVSEHVTVAKHENGSNLTCVSLDSGLVFFDTSLSTRVARHFRTAMEQRFGQPTTALVLTHAHLDHILGMGAFTDVSVYASTATRPRWDHFLSVEWDERSIAGYAAIFPTLPGEIADAELREPTHWFAEKLELGSDERRLVVRRFGGHTQGSAAAWVSPDDVVIAGDLVQAARRPYFGEPDTDFSAWIGALKTWEAGGAKRICPGHGPVIDRAELAVIRAWFEAAVETMSSLKVDGAAFEEVLAGDRLPEGYWPAEGSIPRWWGYCVKRLYDAS